MNRCPITYDAIEENASYSLRGLKSIARNLTSLEPFPYDTKEQLELSLAMASKMSIQGVQPKVSARLDARKRVFVPVEKDGTFILKPQNRMYPNLPENEDASMKLAAAAGCEVPPHGLIWCKDGSLTYFIKRFDRTVKTGAPSSGKIPDGKIPVEDFAQLAGMSRDTKYDYSVEKIILLLDAYMTFPAIEKAKFFRLFLVNFLLGNEDAHLKNYSVITRNGKNELSPCYDIVNSTLALCGRGVEESALPLDDKKRNLTAKDLFEYLAVKRLKLTDKTTGAVTAGVKNILPLWQDIIEKSFLSPENKTAYREIVGERYARLFEA